MTLFRCTLRITNDVDQTANGWVEDRGLRDRMDQLEMAMLTKVGLNFCCSSKRSVSYCRRLEYFEFIVGLLKGLIEFLQQIRDQLDRFKACGVERVGHEEYTAEMKHVRNRNVQLDFGGGEKAVLESKEHFRVERFISIMDSTMDALQHRLNADEAICSNYSFLSNPHTPSSGDIKVAVELIQFVGFVKSERVSMP
ncbi:hypothetical protein LOD99_12033 [Oopsacas minuta]|uniref:Uncharacterized protein n=1 Tax=Oopsacas minuta TaxID=111878 RepID=A0AAV7JHE1_9METZ|nr:hypothetical protein LOD99_12033 [Oopsacas minuta]